MQVTIYCTRARKVYKYTLIHAKIVLVLHEDTALTSFLSINRIFNCALEFFVNFCFAEFRRFQPSNNTTLRTLQEEKSKSFPVTCLQTSMIFSHVVSKCVVASYDFVTKILKKSNNSSQKKFHSLLTLSAGLSAFGWKTS